MSFCGNEACDGGFVWVSDRWARHEAGIGQHDTAVDVDADRWAAYRGRCNTVTICTTCSGRGTRTASDRIDARPVEGAA